MEDKIVVYQSFTDPIKAHIVKGLLVSCGIECFLSDVNMITVNLMYSQALGGVKLNVFERDIETINNLLGAEQIEAVTDFSSNMDESGIYCPQCHSANVSYGGSVNRKFGYRHLFIPLLLGLYPCTMRTAYHCFDCHHEFKKAKVEFNS